MTHTISDLIFLRWEPKLEFEAKFNFYFILGLGQTMRPLGSKRPQKDHCGTLGIPIG